MQSLLIFVLLGLGVRGFEINRMDRYRVSDELVSNMELVLPANSLLVTDFDSLYFDLAYTQLKKARLANRIIIHTSLLFRTWYYEGIKKMYPLFYERNRDLLEPARQAFLRFELGDELAIHEAIELRAQAIHKLVSRAQPNGAFVFNSPAYGSYQGWAFQGFTLESYGIVERLHEGNYELGRIPIEKLHFEQILEHSARGDSWSIGLRELYADLFKKKAGVYRIFDAEEASRLELLAKNLKP